MEEESKRRNESISPPTPISLEEALARVCVSHGASPLSNKSNVVLASLGDPNH